jgi:hypothetical protein
MGDIAPSKMPTAKKAKRRDNTDFTQFAKGGEVWDKPRPKGIGKPKALSSAKKASAKKSAAAAGRPYPNLIDNMRAARNK